MSEKQPHGPLNPQHPAEYMAEKQAEILKSAQKQGWGRLLGTAVLGRDVIYTFENQTRIVVPLPSNAKLPG